MTTGKYYGLKLKNAILTLESDVHDDVKRQKSVCMYNLRLRHNKIFRYVMHLF